MKYKRNCLAISHILSKSNTCIINKSNCHILIPKRYEEINFAKIGMDTYIYGLFPIINDNLEYGLVNVMGMVKTVPDKVTTIKIEDIDYYRFDYDPGSRIIDNTFIIRQDSLFYLAINEFIFNGNIPFYVNYEDVAKLFDTSKKYADINAGLNYEVNELIAAMISRSKTNRSVFYRLTEDPKELKPDYIALTSVFYAVNSSVNKIAGNYFSDGLVSALVNPSKSTEKIERLLRT